MSRQVSCLSYLAPHHTYVHPGELIRTFQPVSNRSCHALFSHVDPDVLYAVSDDQTVRLSLADGSSTAFRGYTGNHFCRAGAVTLSDDGTVLYVGYYSAQCVVAYDVATLQLMWKASVKDDVFSIAYHDGHVLAAPRDEQLTVLSAVDGSVVRTLGVVDGAAWGISVFAGLGCVTAVASLLTPCRSAILESQVQKFSD